MGAVLARFGGLLFGELLVSVGIEVRAVPRTLRGLVVAGLVRAICGGRASARVGGTLFGGSLVSSGLEARAQARTLRMAGRLEFAFERFIENGGEHGIKLYGGLGLRRLNLV